MCRRVKEAWERGATEVCMQGGINPDYSGKTYLSILDVVKSSCVIYVCLVQLVDVVHVRMYVSCNAPACASVVSIINRTSVFRLYGVGFTWWEFVYDLTRVW